MTPLFRTVDVGVIENAFGIESSAVPPVDAAPVVTGQQITTDTVSITQEEYNRLVSLSEIAKREDVVNYMASVMSGNNTVVNEDVAAPVVNNEDDNAVNGSELNADFGNFFDDLLKKDKSVDALLNTGDHNTNDVVANNQQQAASSAQEYLRSIAKVSVDMGINPTDVGNVLMSLTPEEQVHIAKMKMDYMKQMQQASVVNPIEVLSKYSNIRNIPPSLGSMPNETPNKKFSAIQKVERTIFD
jgi:hypothetical protein